jgi:outer membrane lipoprotein-sorting protein
MVYTDPPRVKGDKILQRDGGDNIWYYMKRRDVTRHFTGSARKQSAMGSDFSYEDLSQGDFLEDYTAEVLGEEKIDGVKCIKLKCTPTESGPSYDHIILWAGMDDFLTRKIDYFDSDGYLKTLTITDFKTIEGRKIAMNMEMTNKREGSRTVIITESISFKKKPDPSLFTKQALSRELN